MPKFIRKNGRIIPIRESNELQSAKKQALASGLVTGVIGKFAHGMALAPGAHGKAALGFALGAGVVGLGGLANNIRNARNIAKESKGNRSALRETVNLEAHRLAGAWAGQALGPGVKSAIQTRKATYSGLKVVAKQTSKFADWRKFRKAKLVKAIPSIAGLLRK